MVGRGKLFQGIDRKFKEFGGWVDVGLNCLVGYGVRRLPGFARPGVSAVVLLI